MAHVTALAGVRAGATERHGPTASVGGVTSAREEALDTGPVGPGERSVVRSVRGLRWWGTLLPGGVFTVAGATIDVVGDGARSSATSQDLEVGDGRDARQPPICGVQRRRPSPEQRSQL